MNYKRSPQKFVCNGMDLNRPVDLMSPGKYTALKNVQSYQDGRLETRAPLSQINAVATAPDTNIVSSYRLNDYVVNDFKRFLKINTSLYYGDDVMTPALLNSGYSTDPFTAVAYRPDQSSRVFTYLGDAVKMQKANTSGEYYSVGVMPPVTIPDAELDVPLYYALDTAGPSTSPFDSAAGWGNALSADPVSLNPTSRLGSAKIDAILYDTGSTGWACVYADNIGAFVAGMRIILNSGETTTVEEVHSPYTNGTCTIQSIVYDNGGSTGPCTIQPSIPITNLDRNAMLAFASGGGVLARVLSVTEAQDGTYSFRCNPGAALTPGIGIQITPSFRMYTTATHAVSETIASNFLQFATVPSHAGPQGFVYINFGQGSGFNLGYINNRPITVNDYIHLGLNCFNPENLVEIKMILDVSPTTTSTFNAADGIQNAYTISVRPSDFQAAAGGQGIGGGGTQTSVQARITALQIQQNEKEELKFQSNVPGTPGSAYPAQQLALGAGQFCEFRWKIADLVRVGSAQAVNLTSVNAIQIWVTCANPLVDGTDCIVSFSNLYVTGGYGPDTGNNFTPFLYRFRYRSSETGAHSIPGPAMRSGITCLRHQIIVTGVTSLDPQIDKIDWERFGGQILPGTAPTWHYVGTTENTSPTFSDNQETQAILVNPPLDIDAYQPFPISATPVVLQATIAGSAALVTTGTVSPQWAVGTALIINGQVTSLYSMPVGNVLQMADSMPEGTAVTIEIPEPILVAQPLPAIWGPFNESLFACGNILDAGSVYWTNSTDPDGASDQNRVEVCSPSEGLVNGCVFDGRLYVFSDRRMFALIPAFRTSFSQIEQSAQYNVVPIPNSKGLWSRHTLTVGTKIWYLASDGIYETTGADTVKISLDLNPLFNVGDRPGFQVNGFYPIDMQTTSSYQPRLVYHDGMLFFDYQDCQGTQFTMVYVIANKAWYNYQYFAGTSTLVNFHASETGFENDTEVTEIVVGTNAGILYEENGTGSGVEPYIECVVGTPALDMGDSRAQKIFGDIVYDFDTQGVDVQVAPYINNFETPLAPFVVNTTERGISPPQDLSMGVGQFARNLGLVISWTLTT